MLPVLRISDENEVSTMKRTSDKRGFTLMETCLLYTSDAADEL